MDKNRKGFTLVELLAAIVILGILMVFSIPIIVGMLDRSKDKIYVDDAKKMISQAEYQMRSSSNEIEVPDPGNYIAISLVYLDNASFDNPPNKGEYEREGSFVIVKNNGGKLEYSATIVEKVKGGGYKGVKLSTSDELYSRNAIRRVTVFKKNDLDNIVKVLKDLDKVKARKYINDYLGNDYIKTESEFSNFYNYPNSYNGNAISGDNFAPKITKATIDSTASYNALTAKLYIIATDGDNAVNKLKVRISYDGFDDNNAIEVPYGNNEEFTYDLDFKSRFSYDSGGEATVYVTVEDPEHNVAKKLLNYSIQKNLPPEIGEDSVISKRNSDTVNKTKALVSLFVKDDMTSLDNMKVCLVESDSNVKPTSCSNYKPYNEVFSSNNTLEYQFTCNGTCTRNGTTHYLTVFVRDEQNAEASKQFEYTFSRNSKPVFIGDVSVESRIEPFTSTGSKDVVVSFNVEDDLDKIEDLKIKISDGSKVEEHTGNPFTSYDFTFADTTYNGSTRNITVTVTDSEGESVSKTYNNYTLYNNKAPVISEFLVTTRETVCTNPNYICSILAGGSVNANVILSLSDDIDYKDDYKNVKVCVSDKQSDCNNVNSNKFISYENYFETERPITLDASYNGQEVTIYAYAKDSSNKLSEPKTFNYKLYENQAPVITDFNIVSEEEDFTNEGSLNIMFAINGEDDFDDKSDITFKLYEDDVEVISSPLSTYSGKENNKLTLSGSYDGKERNLKAVIIDSQGLTASTEIPYTVYKKAGPQIDNVNVEPVNTVCEIDSACSDSANNSLEIKYTVEVVSPDTITEALPNGNLSNVEMCVSETDNCTNYTSFTNGKGTFTFSANNSLKPYDGSTKTLHVFVREKNSTEVSDSTTVEYEIYKNNHPVIIKSPSIEKNYNNTEENLANIKYSVGVIDDLDSSLRINYCYKIDDGSEQCSGFQPYTDAEKVLDESFFGITDYAGQKITLYSYIADSYAEINNSGIPTSSFVKSEEIDYTLHTDAAPEIYSVYAVYDVEYYDSQGNLVTNVNSANINSLSVKYINAKITFKAMDPLDSYSYCISTDETCSNYNSITYSGDDTSIHRIDYNNEMTDMEVFSVMDSNNAIRRDYYLFLKDSTGKEIHTKFNFVAYKECADMDDNTVEYEYIYSEENGEPEISMSRCEGKCYYSYEDGDNTVYNNIVSYYNQKITYKDRFDSSKQCTQKYLIADDKYTDVKPYTARCDFYKCFEKSNGTVNTNAIGTRYNEIEYTHEDEITHEKYVCNGYYNLYKVTYSKHLGIVSVEHNGKLCDTVYERYPNKYKYTASEPYVRIAD